MHCLSDGKFEIHPDVLWEQVQGVIKSCLDGNLIVSLMKCVITELNKLIIHPGIKNNSSVLIVFGL